MKDGIALQITMPPENLLVLLRELPPNVSRWLCITGPYELNDCKVIQVGLTTKQVEALKKKVSTDELKHRFEVRVDN